MKIFPLSIVLKWLIPFALIHQSSSSFQNNIYIDPDLGNDGSQCLTANSPRNKCATLRYAFKHCKPSTRYILANTTHNLNATVPKFENLSSLAIVSEDAWATIICTEGETGLAFINVSSLSLSNLVFLNCSANRNSTSIKNLTEGTLFKFQVAVYFYLCRDVSMSQVNVSFSPNATGIVMYDTVGTNVFQNCTFLNNSVSGESVGGGGFYVEFTFCSPTESHCNSSSQNRELNNNGASYLFRDCYFFGNLASNAGIKNSSTYIIPHQSSHQAFGRGGGLSIFVKGTAKNNTFEVVDCTFVSNTAEWGGGLFAEFHDQTANNSVEVMGCLFELNSCNYTLTAGTGGGGIRLGHYVYDYNNFNDDRHSNNRINVASCNFTSNLAMYGGGLSISPTLQNTSPGYESLVTLKDLNFTSNTGKIGAALHIGLFPLVTIGIPLKVTILTCSFVNNSAHYATLLGKEDDPHMIGIGTVYIYNVPVHFQGENLFKNSTGTGLAIAGVPVNFCNSNNTFYNNLGYRGGAISLLGSTYLLINSGTEFHFINNTATDKGGAIYNRYIEMDNIKGQPNCFVRHTDPLLSPDEWKAVFNFVGNSDHMGENNNSIHTTSINSCSRAGGNSFYGNIAHLLCWRNWTYSDSNHQNVSNCSKQITSDAGDISRRKPSGHSMEVIPGHQFQLPFSILDDYGNDLINETVLSDSNATLHRSKYIWGGNATLSGPENSTTLLVLDVLGDRIWHMNLEVKLKPCPAGLVARNKSRDNNLACECSAGYGGAILCDSDSLKVSIKSQCWIGKQNWSNESEKYMVGQCPPGFCSLSRSTLPIDADYNEDYISSRVCSSNRTGIMCGKCINGSGPAVNSLHYECVFCTDISLVDNTAKYLASIYLPLAILFSVLIVFDIRLTTAPANAFILYCQLVASTFNLDADGQVHMNITISYYQALVNVYRVPYGIFNLEFVENLLHPFCLSSRFNVLSVLMLDYGVAFFPLLMIIMAVLCLRLKECCSGSKCCKVTTESQPSKLCEFFQNKRSITEALLPAFAAFILLSYTKFSLTSSHIMNMEYLTNEMGSAVGTLRVYYAGHFSADDTSYKYIYLLPSSIIFALFVCIIPILLLVYPLRAFEWCLSKIHFLWRWYPTAKIHVFLDTFQGCYKIKMRFFAGIYFIFRLITSVTSFATKDWLQQYVAQQIVCMIMVALVAIFQPYNKENRIFNYIDVLIFTNLAIINALSLYLYASTLASNKKAPSQSIFMLQYVLILLPLAYMIMYVLWYAMKKCLKGSKHSSFCCKCLKTKTFQPSINTIIQEGTSDDVPITRSELNIDDYEEGEDEALFARAEMKNLFRSPSISSGGSESIERVPSGYKPGSSKRTNSTSAKTTGSKGYGSISSTERSNSHSGKRSTN